MTDEELEKEAKEWVKGNSVTFEDEEYGMEYTRKPSAEEAYIAGAESREKSIAELERENAKLNRQLSDIVECFQSASSGDDFEMAEAAREIMEIMEMSCYRHGEVKSKLSEAKKIITDMLRDIPNRMWYTDDVIKRAEDFVNKSVDTNNEKC